MAGEAVAGAAGSPRRPRELQGSRQDRATQGTPLGPPTLVAQHPRVRLMAASGDMSELVFSAEGRSWFRREESPTLGQQVSARPEDVRDGVIAGVSRFHSSWLQTPLGRGSGTPRGLPRK